MEAIQYLNVSNKSLLILLLSNLVRPSHSGQLSLLPSARWETVTRQETVAVIRGWEGNRRYSFAPVMRQRPRGIYHLRALGPHSKEVYSPPILKYRSMTLFTFHHPFICNHCTVK